MGLFGYGQKDYAKNAGLFKREILALSERTVGNFEIGKLLDKVIAALDAGYPAKASGKELEAIDKRIEGLIETIGMDIRRGNFATAVEHAGMLLSAVGDARANGKELHTPEELKAAEEKAQMLGKMNEMLLRREAIEKERAKLIEQCAGLDKTSAKFSINHRKWKELGVEVDTINGDLTEYEKAYNTRAKMLNMKKSAINAGELKGLMNVNPSQFAHMMEERSQAYESVSNTVDTIEGIIGDAKAGDASRNSSYEDDGFASAVDMRKNAQLADEISGATVSPDEEEDEFTRATKGRN